MAVKGRHQEGLSLTSAFAKSVHTFEKRRIQVSGRRNRDDGWQWGGGCPLLRLRR